MKLGLAGEGKAVNDKRSESPHLSAQRFLNVNVLR